MRQINSKIKKNYFVRGSIISDVEKHPYKLLIIPAQTNLLLFFIIYFIKFIIK
jgi:hypothetical protein